MLLFVIPAKAEPSDLSDPKPKTLRSGFRTACGPGMTIPEMDRT